MSATASTKMNPVYYSDTSGAELYETECFPGESAKNQHRRVSVDATDLCLML